MNLFIHVKTVNVTCVLVQKRCDAIENHMPVCRAAFGDFHTDKGITLNNMQTKPSFQTHIRATKVQAQFAQTGSLSPGNSLSLVPMFPQVNHLQLRPKTQIKTDKWRNSVE